MRTKPKINKILFYTGNFNSLRSFPLVHLYEVSQVYPTILLVEKLDPDIEEILNNKKFFPKLEKIVFIQYPYDSLKLIIKNNKPLYKTAETVIQQYKPDVVITTGKNLYPFELYLRKIAKRIGAINICSLGPLLFKAKDGTLEGDLISVHLYFRKLKFLPFYIKLLLIKLRKQIGQFLYFWILPLMVGEIPFRKEPGSALLRKNFSRCVDYYISFSRQDYNLYLQEGMPAKKLYILPSLYSLEFDKVRKFLKRKFIHKKFDKFKGKRKILTFMWPPLEIGIKRGNFALISKEEMQKTRIKILTLITEILKGWKIFIKPHPGIKPDLSEAKKTHESVFTNIEILDPSESAEAHIEISDVIIGASTASTTIYTASVMCPEKPILALDLQNEFLGDFCKNLKGVECINNEEKLINALKLIRDNKYRKQYIKQKKEKLGEKEFSNTVGLLEYLFNKKSNICSKKKIHI